jgi:acyl-CoA synthetase (AMP-forming)/AMP-acid ligase II
MVHDSQPKLSVGRPDRDKKSLRGVQEVRDFLSKRLANFKVPRVVEFRNTLPREDTGKIYKRRLQDEYLMRQ